MKLRHRLTEYGAKSKKWPLGSFDFQTKRVRLLINQLRIVFVFVMLMLANGCISRGSNIRNARHDSSLGESSQIIKSISQAIVSENDIQEVIFDGDFTDDVGGIDARVYLTPETSGDHFIVGKYHDVSLHCPAGGEFVIQSWHGPYRYMGYLQNDDAESFRKLDSRGHLFRIPSNGQEDQIAQAVGLIVNTGSSPLAAGLSPEDAFMLSVVVATPDGQRIQEVEVAGPYIIVRMSGKYRHWRISLVCRNDDIGIHKFSRVTSASSSGDRFRQK